MMRKNILFLGLLGVMVFGLTGAPIQADFIQCSGGAGCVGTAVADLINGTADDDEVRAMEGEDVIFLGDGNDEGDGGEGNDTIFGGPGSDGLDGEEGNDYLAAGPDVVGFAQSMSGNEGNDNFFVLSSEVTECLLIDIDASDDSGEEDFGNDAVHLLGFGPYTAVKPFGQAGFVEGFVHVLDPITGGDIFIYVIEATDEGVETINGLPSPNVTILALDDQLILDCAALLVDVED